LSKIKNFQERLLKAKIKRSLRIRLPRYFPKSRILRVLAICCYLADKPNLVENLLDSVKESKNIQIDLILSNNSNNVSTSIFEQPHTHYFLPNSPKFVAVSRILKEQLKPYHDYVIIIDDDVELPHDFFDRYFRVVDGLGLKLSQPALTKKSKGSWDCCWEIDNAIAHIVSFIEIGPITCFEKNLASYLPFVGDSPMGWGLDFVWARICLDRHWPMGVVDLVSVKHRLRHVGKYYDIGKEDNLMNSYLVKTKHVPLWVPTLIGQVIFRKNFPELS
jgi:hypothetical protein